jgi:hypothetical protein
MNCLRVTVNRFMVLCSPFMRNRLLLFAAFCALALLLFMVRPLRGPGERELAKRRAALLQTGRGVVTTAVADLYSRPDAESELVDQALLGDTLTIVPGQRGGALPLIEVETGSRYRGFAPVVALTPWPQGAPPYAAAGRVAAVAARFANIYLQPDVTLRNPAVVAPLGARLHLVEELDARWLRISLPDGRRAHVQRGDVLVDPAPRLTAACLTGHAQEHAGTPYLWGGRSTYGIDCSGLLVNAFAACGVIAPRDAHLQYDWSEVVPVEPAQARPGDLLFFRSGGGGAGQAPKVTHVGLYLGQDRFVHATTSERPTVHESRFSDAAWQARLVGVRRHKSLQ